MPKMLIDHIIRYGNINYRWRTSTSAPVKLQCHIALHR